MILYKNVDICDLESILNKGILSLRESGNDNWNSSNRADNSIDKVYLFSPIGSENSFPNYGVALIEVDVNDAEEQFMSEHDAYFGRYKEYVCDKVLPEQIKAIYIPEIFKEKISISSSIFPYIMYVDIEATYYDEDDPLIDSKPKKCPEDVLKQFAETAPFMKADSFNFFRGITEKRHMIDLYDIVYCIPNKKTIEVDNTLDLTQGNTHPPR